MDDRNVASVDRDHDVNDPELQQGAPTLTAGTPRGERMLSVICLAVLAGMFFATVAVLTSHLLANH